MVCRLCLVDLNDENAITLFETCGMYSEKPILKMIAKHFYLELSRDDPVSTSICPNCSKHLEDFHRFWIYVDQKQSTLRNEFLEVKCEVNILSEGNEESLLDLKNISMEFAEVTPVEEFGCANQIDANNVEEVDTAATVAFDDSSSDSVDDHASLSTLRTRSKTKKAKKCNVPKRTNSRKKVFKVKLQDDTDEEDSESMLLQTQQQHSESESNAQKSLQKQFEETIANFMKLSCDICNCSLDNFRALRKHFKTSHQRSAYVKCCSHSFSTPSMLVDHIRWHQNPDVYKCNICEKRLRSEIALQKHRELHLTSNDDPKITSARNRICEICNESFVTARSLQRHNVSIHKIISENDKDNNCEICNKSFLTGERLRLHITNVHNNIWYICDTCGKKFKFKPAFKKHLLEHEGIVGPPAQCDICGTWLKNKRTLFNHRLKHDTVQHDCNICGRKCTNIKALNKHIRYMHKLKNNLQCNMCEKSFKLPQSLEEHVATHTGALLYSCPHCATEFRSKSNMYVHVKRAHLEEWLQSKVARSNDPNMKTQLE